MRQFSITDGKNVEVVTVRTQKALVGGEMWEKCHCTLWAQ